MWVLSIVFWDVFISTGYNFITCAILWFLSFIFYAHNFWYSRVEFLRICIYLLWTCSVYYFILITVAFNNLYENHIRNVNLSCKFFFQPTSHLHCFYLQLSIRYLNSESISKHLSLRRFRMRLVSHWAYFSCHSL